MLSPRDLGGALTDDDAGSHGIAKERPQRQDYLHGCL